MVYVHCAVNKGITVNSDQSIVREAERVLREILESVGGFESIETVKPPASDEGCDVLVQAKSHGAKLLFAIEAKTLITPRRAPGAWRQLQHLPKEIIRLIYAPVISPRVASFAKEQGIGYIDAAGNCWIHSERHRLLIERRGLKSDRKVPKSSSDPFSPKSSRIVRAMLSKPAKGWQVRELADDDDVGVSPGLVVKVKRALIDEGYAIEHENLLYLLDPLGLLENWSTMCPGPTQKISVYIRGDTGLAEETVHQWCERNKLTHARAGFSAAWRLAPETRYNLAAMYVEDKGFEDRLLEMLADPFGGKQVESGANLELWRPFDQSVFAGMDKPPGSAPVTSPLQTYLDVKRAAGRGEEAARAIFDKYLRSEFTAAANRAKELFHGI
jgi:hypothetical protein